MNCDPFPQLGLYRYRALMQFDQVASDGEAQPGAALTPR